ncbi:MAG: hypothetical protein PVH88_01535 [Ignavibacteria bacterium]
MNKIVLNFGLLVFFLSIVVYSQQGLMIEDILIKAFVIFVVVTIMLSILAIAFLKAINRASLEKGKQLNENLIGNKDE